MAAGAAAAAGAVGWRKAGAADTPGVTATEIKIGNTMPYSGPASAYGVIGKIETAFFKMVNEQGGIAGRKINFISLRRRLQPAQDGGAGAPAGRGGQGRVPVQHAGHADQLGDRAICEPEEGAASVRRHRRRQMGRLQALPLDDGLAAELPDRSADLRQIHPEAEAGREDRDPVSERRFRQGLPGRRARTCWATNTPRCRDRGVLRDRPIRRSTARSSRCRRPAPTCCWSRRRRNSPRRRSARSTTWAGSRCSS